MNLHLTARLRRMRRNETLRRMARETRLSVDNLIAPLFVRPGAGVRNPIASMPGQCQFSPDTLAEEARALADLGVPAVILFGIPDHKDAEGSGAYDPDGIIPRAVAAVTPAEPGMAKVATPLPASASSASTCPW